MRPLKIVYTHRTQGIGAEGAHILGMVEAFRELGHTVVMDCLPGCDPEENAGKAAAAGAAVSPAQAPKAAFGRRVARVVSEHTPQWLFGWLELLYNAPLMVRLWSTLRRERPDLVYERYALCTFAPTALCRWLDIPHVLEVNDSVVIERSRPLKLRRISRFLEERILRATRLIITISGQFKRQICDAFPVSEEKIRVCPNAVSERKFLTRVPMTNDTRESLRRRCGVRGTAVLGSAGQFVAWHGLAAFVEAISPLVVEKDLFLLFIGDGPIREETLEAARRAGIGDRVVFTGMVPHDEVPDYLELLDIAVIPFSNVHGSPMKLMEFMAMGLPAVAPDLAPVREVLRERETGRIFEIGDMQAMAACLRELLEDRVQAKALGAAARDHVYQHLTWRVHALGTLAALGLNGGH